MIAVPATLVGWHFTVAYNRHSDREKARARRAREALRDSRRSFALPEGGGGGGSLGSSGSAQQQGAGGGGSSAQQQRALVREAVQEAVGSLREEVRELRELLRGQLGR